MSKIYIVNEDNVIGIDKSIGNDNTIGKDMVFAIDPGTTKSAWLVYDNNMGKIKDFGIWDNVKLYGLLLCWSRKEDTDFVIEMIKSYGNVMGDSTIETCVWIGKFESAWGHETNRLTRKAIVTNLCHNPRAKDKNVMQALKDKHGPVGTKSNPGPLYGIKKDIWSALAVCTVWREIRHLRELMFT